MEEFQKETFKGLNPLIPRQNLGIDELPALPGLIYFSCPSFNNFELVQQIFFTLA